jgi:hypothetical protein
MSRCCRFSVPPVSRITSSFPSRPKIHPVSGPKIDPVLKHALPYSLDVRQVSLFEPRDRHGDLRPRRCIQRREPAFERAAPILGQVVADFEHRPDGNIGVTDESINIYIENRCFCGGNNPHPARGSTFFCACLISRSISSSLRPAAITRARNARRPGISSSGSITIVTRSSGSRPRFASSAATLLADSGFDHFAFE